MQIGDIVKYKSETAWTAKGEVIEVLSSDQIKVRLQWALDADGHIHLRGTAKWKDHVETIHTAKGMSHWGGYITS